MSISKTSLESALARAAKIMSGEVTYVGHERQLARALICLWQQQNPAPQVTQEEGIIGGWREKHVDSAAAGAIPQVPSCAHEWQGPGEHPARFICRCGMMVYRSYDDYCWD